MKKEMKGRRKIKVKRCDVTGEKKRIWEEQQHQQQQPVLPGERRRVCVRWLEGGGGTEGRGWRGEGVTESHLAPASITSRENFGDFQ